MSRKRVKQYLMLLTVVGLIAVAANGAGTFASFSAETVNKGNTFATGTLFLHNTNGSTTCTSESDTSNGVTTAPTGCAALFSVSSVAANTTQHADLTLTNAGTIAAADLLFATPQLASTATCDNSAVVIAKLNGAVTATGTVGASLSTSALTQALVASTPLKITDITTPANTQTFTVDTAGAAQGATSIPVHLATTWSHNFDDKSPITINTNFGGTGLCGSLTLSIASYPTSAYAAGQGTCVYGGTGTADDTTGCSSGTALSSVGSTFQSLSQTIASGASKYLRLFITAPSSLDNTAQNEQATFDLGWKITQA